jgi:hypothetical protein
VGDGNGLFECHIAASVTKTLALSRVRFEAVSTADGVFEFGIPGSCLPRFNLPRDVAQTAHGVASDIKRRTASELVVEAEVILAEPDVGRQEAGLEVNQPAELSACHELALATQPLEVANVHGFNENEAALRSQLEQALRLVRILRQRLLAQHMFARFERPTPPFVMEGGRKRDIHGIYVFGLQQRLVGAEAALNSMACSKLFGLLPRSPGN